MVYTKLCSHPLPCTPTHSHQLPFTPTHFYSFLTHSYSFSALSDPLPTHVQLTPTHFKHTHDHAQPLSRISSTYANTHTKSNPSPTIPTHIQPLYFTCLRALHTCVLTFVFHMLMCLCNSFLCTLLLMSIYFTCLCVC